MSISDRLDQMERESVDADEQWDCGRSAFNADNYAPPIDAALANGERTLAALRAVLDVCGEVEDQHHPDRMYEGGMEEMAHRVLVAIHKTLGETP